MTYRYEITSTNADHELAVGCVFEAEGVAPLIYFNAFAADFFAQKREQALSGTLELRRYLLKADDSPDESLLCMAEFKMIDGVPTVRMVAGPIMKDELAASRRIEP
ncbi:MAG: hypothetical protein EON90_10810 [Brevundimonas sp.]|nr:MAG: hypothetical protein EON90_10810 [Brevundimonas sp.]